MIELFFCPDRLEMARQLALRTERILRGDRCLVLVTVLIAFYASLSTVTATESFQLLGDPQKIAPGQYLALDFSVDLDRGENFYVGGWYNASGASSESDIFCFLCDEANYELVMKGESANALYSSGHPVTHDEFNVSITSAGRYYLVFSNAFSIADKTVWGDIKLTWEERALPIPEAFWAMWLVLVGLVRSAVRRRPPMGLERSPSLGEESGRRTVAEPILRMTQMYQLNYRKCD